MEFDSVRNHSRLKKVVGLAAHHKQDQFEVSGAELPAVALDVGAILSSGDRVGEFVE
jgi:hypothetical protein